MTRRRRRTLRFAMWACVACSVLMTGAWIGSPWYAFYYNFTNAELSRVFMIEEGDLAYSQYDRRLAGGAPWPGLYLVRTKLFAVPTSRLYFHRDDLGCSMSVPVWLLALLVLAPAVACHRLSRRPIPGRCPRCGYDLSGVPAGVCPECGGSPGS